VSKLTRRTALVALGGAAAGMGLGALYRARADAAEPCALIRPPGALDEPAFLAACIRCGLCVEACPPEYRTLALLPLSAGAAAATPYVDDMRHRPCSVCQGYDEPKCIEACPTEALQPVNDVSDIRMGLARIDEATCWPFTGVSCRACWHACPWPDDAIQLDERLRPKINEATCTGCGLCQRACPSEPESIIIEAAPRNGAVGRGGGAA